MTLRVKPILTYELHQRCEGTSWRLGGGLQSEGDVEEEARRIKDELGRAVATAPFDLEVSPVSCIGSVDDLARIKDELRDHDAVLYAAGGGRDILEGVVSSSNWSLIFLT